MYFHIFFTYPTPNQQAMHLIEIVALENIIVYNRTQYVWSILLEGQKRENKLIFKIVSIKRGRVIWLNYANEKLIAFDLWCTILKAF